jgi:predicted nucleotidyltransferase
MWMPCVLACIQQTLGKRLLYLGLQGSYRQGEATEKSDIEIRWDWMI